MKALISGITGQDGSYLSEYLLDLGYTVHGIVRRNSVPQNQTSRIDHILSNPNLFLHYADLTDSVSLHNVIQSTKPDEVYHLGAQSHVGQSFEIPMYTAQVNALGTLSILEAVKMHCPDCKVYHAATSELFGNNVDDDGFQRESTPFNPVSPYGSSKLYAHSVCANYRRAYNMFVVSGILFNHESPRRGVNFVTNKVAKTAVEIKCGITNKLELGTLKSKRDWGHAKDYVEAMFLMMHSSTPKDYVVATGESRSVQDLVNTVFDMLDLDPQRYVALVDRYKRPEELWALKGDSGKIRTDLGWKPKYTFEKMIEDMIEYWLKKYERLK